MNKHELQQQLNTSLNQYRFEVQNQELKTQIQVAQNTISQQNQHITDMFNSMNFIIVVIGIFVAIFGIIVPIIMTIVSIKNKNELKQIKENVDDFILNKFKEWENEKIDKSLDRYLNNEILWTSFHANANFELMTYERMKKVIDCAISEGNKNPKDFLNKGYNIITYVFDEHCNNKNKDFENIRKYILNCKYFYTLVMKQNHLYAKSIKFCTEQQQEKLILDLLKNSDIVGISNAVRAILEVEYLTSTIEKLIAEKIIEQKDILAVRKIENNENIVNLLLDKNIFDEANIFKPINNEMQLNWYSTSSISADSYLAKKLQEKFLYFNA